MRPGHGYRSPSLATALYSLLDVRRYYRMRSIRHLKLGDFQGLFGLYRLRREGIIVCWRVLLGKKNQESDPRTIGYVKLGEQTDFVFQRLRKKYIEKGGSRWR